MAIRVSHRPSAAAIGQAAFSAGRGRALQRERERQLTEQARFEMMERQQEQAEIGMQFQLAQQQQAQQARMGVEEQRQANALEQIQTRFELGQQDRRQQFTEKQHHQLQQIDAMIATIEADDTLTPDQKQMAIREARFKAQGITPPERQPPTPQEEFESTIVTDPETGVRGMMTSSGFKPLVDPSSRQAVDTKTGELGLKMAQAYADNEAGTVGAPITALAMEMGVLSAQRAMHLISRDEFETALADLRGSPENQEGADVVDEDTANLAEFREEVSQRIGQDVSPFHAERLMSGDPNRVRGAFDELAQSATPETARALMELMIEMGIDPNA